MKRLMQRMVRRWIASSAFIAFLLAGIASHAATNAPTTTEVWLDGYKVFPTRILAAFKGEEVPADASGTLAALGSKIERRFPAQSNLVLLEDTAPAPAGDAAAVKQRLMERIDALKQSGRFEYVEPDYVQHAFLTPNDQAFTSGVLWSLRNYGQNGGVPKADISATNAWDITTGSTNVIVAVIDTGVRYTHRDLATNMWHNPGEIPGNGIDDDNDGYVDDVFGIDPLNGDGDPMDDNDHGTHVSGTIGAAANDGNPHVGISWKVRIMALKFLPGGSTADAITCIDYAVAHGARILNNSWGGGGFSSALYQSIKRARDAGVLFVAAAGNSGWNNDIIPNYPSNYDLDNIIAVAATDRRDNLADFSQYGYNSVDLAAPGVSIFSSIATSDTAYDSFDGTSMATPHVSGVAALILSVFPGADASEMKSRIMSGVDVLPSLSGLCVTGGRLNAYKALNITGSGLLQMTITPPNGSALLRSSAQTILVDVTDPPISVANATVSATVTGVGPVTFKNNGTPPDAIANDRTYTGTLNVPNATNTLTMTVSATAPGKVGITNVITYYVVDAPVNDHFTNAIKAPVAGATYHVNNLFATRESGEPRHANVQASTASLWWNYTPSSGANVFLDTSGSAVDTVLAVYTGTAVSNLTTVVATNDIGSKRQAYLTLPAVSGTTYRIAVASVSSNAVGSIQFRITPGGGPDETQPLVAISSPMDGLTVTTNGVVIAGTASDPDPNSTGVSDVLISVNGSFGSSASGTTNWSRFVPLNPGLNTITVTSVDASGNVSAPAVVHVNYFVPGPANDFFVNAQAITSNSGSRSVNTAGATFETGEPNHAGVHGGKSIWYKFTAPADGSLFLSTLGSSFDTLLALYTGSSVSSLNLIASNDDAFSGAPGRYSQIDQAVQSGVTYYIAVDGYDGLSGTAVLSNYFAPKIVFQVSVNSAGGGSVSPSVATVASNGTVTVAATPDANYLFDIWDGSVTSVSNPLTLVVQSNLTLTAHFRPATFTDGFESGDLHHIAWVTAGNLPWIVRTNVVATGSFAARSGFITDVQSSSLSYSGDFQAGNLSFVFRVSSEVNYDWLRLFVDGSQQDQWSGETGWLSYSLPLTAGNHTVEWRYVKDASLSQGLDAAFLDNVNLPLVVANTTTFQAHMEIRTLVDGTTIVDLTGQPDQTYVFQSSSDMVNWSTFSTKVAVGGFARALDSAANAGQRRYYRAFAPAP